jgi:hypothetical protein
MSQWRRRGRKARDYIEADILRSNGKELYIEKYTAVISPHD